MKLSDVAGLLPASPIRKLVPYAHAAKKNGIHIYHLNIGDPDIETPEVMLDVILHWKKKTISYADSHGQHELLKSLVGYYQRLGHEHLTIHNLQVTAGGSEGLLWTMLTVANSGDEILVFEPYYANYNSFSVLARVNLVPVLTHIENGFHLPKPEDIEKKITKKTKGILICNPGNPTGTVYTKKELDLLVRLAKKHHLYLLSDEVYREFTYDGTKAISMLEYTHQYPEGIIMIDSLSKRYSICGARLGVLVSYNKEFMDAVLKFAQSRLSAGFIDQLMAAKLSDVPRDYFRNVNNEYRERRDVLYEHLHKIPGVYCRKPEGAFYLIVKLPVKNAENFAKWLLTDFHDRKETVMIAPAQGFYKSQGLGVDEVRIAYVINKKSLIRSAELLKKALKAYKD